MVRYAESIARVRSWQMHSQGMLITGPSGRGKSRALWDLLRRLMCREGREVRVFRSADFFRRLQEHIKYGSDESRLWLKLLAETPLLALDDWGQEAVTNARANWCEATFFDLLDQRLGNRLPIIITTNLTARQIADSDHENVRSDPLLRRLLDACHVVPFERAAE
jgi:DNA replication protein DnaC